MAEKEHAMTVKIAMDGDVISVKDKHDKDAPVAGVPSGNRIIKEIDIKIIVSEGSKCVTYQTPRGPYTV